MAQARCRSPNSLKSAAKHSKFLHHQFGRQYIQNLSRNSYALLSKRLERGTFRLPAAQGDSVALSGAELAMLLEGIELSGTRRRKRIILNNV